jgi:CAAX protease family protein
MADEDRFNRFEYPSGDFPYYNGLPVGISGREWLFILGMVLLGFLALVAPVPLFAGRIGQFIPAILFFAIPLAGLAVVAPRYWTALFRRVGGRDILWMVGSEFSTSW